MVCSPKKIMKYGLRIFLMIFKTLLASPSPSLWQVVHASIATTCTGVQDSIKPSCSLIISHGHTINIEGGNRKL
jgi:hypothetical protein